MPRLSKTRRDIVAAAMKESIYEAALAVLCKFGVSGITMSRVAEAANVTKGNLYHYFRDKDELLQVFDVRLLQPYFQAAEDVAKSDLPAPLKLEKLFRTTWEYISQHKGLVRLLAERTVDAKVRKNVRPRGLRIFTAVVEQGIREGVFRSHNSEHIGRVLYGAMWELVELLTEGVPDEKINTYVESLVDVALHGFSVYDRENESIRLEKGSVLSGER